MDIARVFNECAKKIPYIEDGERGHYFQLSLGRARATFPSDVPVNDMTFLAMAKALGAPIVTVERGDDKLIVTQYDSDGIGLTRLSGLSYF